MHAAGPNAQVNPRVPRKRRDKHQPTPLAAYVELNRLLGQRQHYTQECAVTADVVYATQHCRNKQKYAPVHGTTTVDLV